MLMTERSRFDPECNSVAMEKVMGGQAVSVVQHRHLCQGTGAYR